MPVAGAFVCLACSGKLCLALNQILLFLSSGPYTTSRFPGSWSLASGGEVPRAAGAVLHDGGSLRQVSSAGITTTNPNPYPAGAVLHVGGALRQVSLAGSTNNVTPTYPNPNPQRALRQESSAPRPGYVRARLGKQVLVGTYSIFHLLLFCCCHPWSDAGLHRLLSQKKKKKS